LSESKPFFVLPVFNRLQDDRLDLDQIGIINQIFAARVRASQDDSAFESKEEFDDQTEAWQLSDNQHPVLYFRFIESGLTDRIMAVRYAYMSKRIAAN
jgi:hypothetical protein